MAAVPTSAELEASLLDIPYPIFMSILLFCFEYFAAANKENTNTYAIHTFVWFHNSVAKRQQVDGFCLRGCSLRIVSYFL